MTRVTLIIIGVCLLLTSVGIVSMFSLPGAALLLTAICLIAAMACFAKAADQ